MIYLQRPGLKDAQTINRHRDQACVTSERLENVLDHSVMFHWWLCTQRWDVLANHIQLSVHSNCRVLVHYSYLFIATLKCIFQVTILSSGEHYSLIMQINELLQHICSGISQNCYTRNRDCKISSAFLQPCAVQVPKWLKVLNQSTQRACLSSGVPGHRSC